jgi:O-antigen/teichoic acid export membrane protein
MAVSSGSAYFIFQLFNPVLFNYHGPIVAGQMGMTLTAANALLAGGMTVLNAKTPEFGKLIAVRDWEGLDRLFFRVTRHALTLVLVGAVVGFLAIWQLQVHFTIGHRFIPAGLAALLFGTVFFQAAAGAFANYLRAHKKEPLMKMTILASLLQGSGTWYLGKHYASIGVTAGFFAVTACFVFPYVLFVWRRCRQEWHRG